MSWWTVFSNVTGEGVFHLFDEGGVGNDLGLNQIAKQGYYAIADMFMDTSDLDYPVLPRVAVPYSLDTSAIDADGVDFATISNLPITPVFITVRWPDGSRDTLTGDYCEFAVTVPGTYDIILTSPIHLDTTVTITAI